MDDEIKKINFQIRKFSEINDLENLMKMFEERNKIINSIEKKEDRIKITEEMIIHDQNIFNFIEERINVIEKELMKNKKINEAMKKYDEF